MRKFLLTMVSVAVMTATAAVPAFAACNRGTPRATGKCAVQPAWTCQTAECNASCGASQCKTPVSLNCAALGNLSLDQILALFCQNCQK